jgi:RHS repeat-associated protein
LESGGDTAVLQYWYMQSLARIDEVLNVTNDTGKFWHQADALASVYGLTNQAGALVGSQNYDVFGAPMPAPTGPAGQPFGFTGREHERNSGLVYARARYLNPAVGRWDRPDPLGFLDGPNHYGYVRGNPTRYSDPTGFAARTTVEAYAMRWPFAFVMLLMDLGAISELALFVGSAGAVAIPISHIISAEWSRERARDRTDACPIPAPPPVERTYYRGLSWDDLREFELFGVVLSKFARAGGDFIEALEYFITGVRTHSWNSDDIGGGIPSPFVSTSTNEATARGFAERESKVVISLRTERAGVPIDNRFFGEDEVLFFLMLGMPGEQMEIVP